MNGSTKVPRPAPWAIRGVSAEARNAAMAAARREGLTLGEWVDRAIRGQVQAGRNALPGPTLEDTLTRLTETLERQNERLAVLEHRPSWIRRLLRG